MNPEPTNDMNTRPTTPYPADPTIASPQPGYVPANPQFEVTPIQYIRRTNVASALGPTPSQNPIPPSGQTAACQPPTDRELRINLPPSYDGNRKKYKTFQNAIVLYLGINRHIYHNDEKKIGFVLSYLNDKEAAQWCEAWIEWNTRAGLVWFPFFGDFIDELNAAFEPVDAVGDAMHKLRTLKQGTRSAEELVTEFNLFCSQAGIIQSGDTTLINLFQPALNKPLLEKILDGETVPTTIAGWKTKAIQLDNNYRRKMAILGKTRDNRGQQTTNTGRRFYRPNNQQTKDPNAMDVDALSIKQREEAMKKGACFGCGEIGHISRNCPKKQWYGGQGGNAGKAGQTGASKTWTKGKELLSHIHTLTAGLAANEMEEFMKEAEETGF
jgi:hypothetical protein